MHTLSFRLEPGQDLIESINQIVQENEIQAGCIITCVGSLREAMIRFANREEHTKLVDDFEIVSLVGCLGTNGGSHIHLSISDPNGKMIGGHSSSSGCIVRTTAEIVIGVLSDVGFERKPCAKSGYDELVVKPTESSS